MQFCLLGPLLVHDGDQEIAVPAARQRVLLAALMVRTGRIIPAGELAELVWDAMPTPGSAATLRSYVKRLRQVLGPQAGARVVTRYPGYILAAANDEVDFLRFTGLCRDGSAAVRDGSWAQASSLLSEALGLWRGAAMADVPSSTLQDEPWRLEQLRLQALEWRIDADLHLGLDSELMPELQALATEHPLRERFHAQLMIALYRCGRQADALAAYRHARQLLVNELGTDPGSELRELHQRILYADPTLLLPVQATRLHASALPRQLPAPASLFTGRDREMAELTALLRTSGQAPRTVALLAIGGPAGAGKTALAVYWAHQVAHHFPDGQLYVDLRGYDPGEAMGPADALAGFLRALAVPGRDIPADLQDRSAQFRSLLAGRRVLVLLDNARSVEHVRPLLPGTPGCAVLVTSRDTLTGLVARDGARRLHLGLLAPDEAAGLLRVLIGARAEAEPESTYTLAEQCSRLPLALRLAAELASARPGVRLADLASELADQRQRLDLFDAGGDPRTAIRTVFSWSYRYLDAGDASAFRLLGLHPGSDFDSFTVAALTGDSVGHSRRQIEALVRGYLIQAGGAGRFAMHDLLKTYAAEKTSDEDDESVRHAALTRLFQYYLSTAAAAMDQLFPAERHSRPAEPPTAELGPPVIDAHTARDWLDRERANLLAAIAYAAENGWPVQATRLAATVFRYLDVGGYYSEAVAIHAYALKAASQVGDLAGEANALCGLAGVDLRQGRYEQSASHYERALALFRATGDQFGEARVLGNLGMIEIQLSHYAIADDYLQRAAVLFREADRRAEEAHALTGLAVIDNRLGRFQQATSRCQAALQLSSDAGDLAAKSYALVNLSNIYIRQSLYQEAASYVQQALDLCRDADYSDGEADVLTEMGALQLGQRRYAEAGRSLEQSLVIYRRVGDRLGEAVALNGLGEVHAATGEFDCALARHSAALDLAIQIRDKFVQARAHAGLASSLYALNDCRPAWQHREKARLLYTEIGAPEARQIGELLTADNHHKLDTTGVARTSLDPPS